MILHVLDLSEAEKSISEIVCVCEHATQKRNELEEWIWLYTKIV